MGRNALTFNTTDTGCKVPVGYKLNKDGYFRKRVKGKLVMYHRHVWEEKNGLIPVGYEIDHICRNRACCNIEHLQLLSCSEHKVKTNKERYAEREQDACQYWLDHNCTATELAMIFEVSVSGACKWVRSWRKQL